MHKKINTSTIVIAVVIVAVVGLLIWNGSNKNKISAPAVDRHGHLIAANSSSVLLDNLKNKLAPEFALADKDGKA